MSNELEIKIIDKSSEEHTNEKEVNWETFLKEDKYSEQQSKYIKFSEGKTKLKITNVDVNSDDSGLIWLTADVLELDGEPTSKMLSTTSLGLKSGFRRLFTEHGILPTEITTVEVRRSGSGKDTRYFVELVR